MQSKGAYQGNQNNGGPSTSAGATARRPRHQGSAGVQPLTPPSAPDVRGRHRRRAELQRLTQEIRMLQDELNALDNIPPASKACKELVDFMDNCPDPFLPSLQGDPPVKQRWFEPPSESQGCCWR
ncbi:hypothetical protein CY35_16G068300 [Sphagnum magellanicum]|jgi:hypothetical protein|nr:hypothetical protein CY35_16G068300 [Sphagnum magellanicum]